MQYVWDSLSRQGDLTYYLVIWSNKWSSANEWMSSQFLRFGFTRSENWLKIFHVNIPTPKKLCILIYMVIWFHFVFSLTSRHFEEISYLHWNLIFLLPSSSKFKKSILKICNFGSCQILYDQALLEVRLAQRFDDKDELTRFQRREWLG